jgi:two-component system, NarL family, response regulator LiaR
MNSQPIQVLFVDDHVMVRKGLKALLEETEDIRMIGEASNGLDAIELVKRLKPDVVLIDVLMPGMGGIDAIKGIVAIQPNQRIVALTDYPEEDYLLQAVKAGAIGCLTKDNTPEELIQTIRNAFAGVPSVNPKIVWMLLQETRDPERTKRPDVKLSKREVDVLRLLSQGKTDQQIAEQLVVGEETIRSHISRIQTKLGTKNRVQAALHCLRSGMVQLNDISQLGDDG